MDVIVVTVVIRGLEQTADIISIVYIFSFGKEGVLGIGVHRVDQQCYNEVLLVLITPPQEVRKCYVVFRNSGYQSFSENFFHVFLFPYPSWFSFPSPPPPLGFLFLFLFLSFSLSSSPLRQTPPPVSGPSTPLLPSSLGLPSWRMRPGDSSSRGSSSSLWGQVPTGTADSLEHPLMRPKGGIFMLAS